MITDHAVVAAFAVRFDPDKSEMDTLRARLAARAEHEELLDVTYRIVDSPFGPLLVAASRHGIVRVAFEREDHGLVLDQLADRISPRILASAARTDDAARQLDEYFGRTRRTFDVALDLQLVHGFRRDVIARLGDIDYGSTATYKAVAASAGHAGAVRAVGSACSHNPLPLVLPCHRVVRSDGTLGNYLGGTATKAALLAMESASS